MLRSNPAPISKKTGGTHPPIFAVTVFGPEDDDCVLTNDFTYAPLGQPHWLSLHHSGPGLMTVIAETMAWAVRYFNNDSSMLAIAVIISRIDDYDPADPDPDYSGQTIMAQWKYDGERWEPFSTDGPHPIPAPRF